MHELRLAMEVVAIATAQCGGERIRRVVVEVGRLALVAPEALRFGFVAAARGTLAEGAALEVVDVPGRGRCRACAAEVLLDGPLGVCACGGVDLEWIGGHQVKVRELEV